MPRCMNYSVLGWWSLRIVGLPVQDRGICTLTCSRVLNKSSLVTCYKYNNLVSLRVASSSSNSSSPKQHKGLQKLLQVTPINPASPTAKRQARESAKKREKSLDRCFISQVRAMNEFMLSVEDLSGLRKTLRRSPYQLDPLMTVYWRKDVEAKALEVHGSIEKLQAAKSHAAYCKAKEEGLDDGSILNIKRVLKRYRKESYDYDYDDTPQEHTESSLLHGSGRIVLAAITINGTNFIIKLMAWVVTGSHSMFAEAIHSLADTINQLILAYGIHKSTQRANLDHPYGYTNMRHVASLISGVGIFCVGAGLSFYHGITGLLYGQPIDSLYWAFLILGGSFLSEGATLFLACRSVKKKSKASNMSFWEYIFRGKDPSLSVVILEDTAAVSGVAVAALCMGLSMHTGSPIPDAVGSLIIGGLLASTASFIIYSNSAVLVGRSIPQDQLDKINRELEADLMVRAIHDVKGIDIGNDLIRYKAEIDFDGRELTAAYLDKVDTGKLLEEARNCKNTVEVEDFLLKHGENIVDTMGAEVDRIESKLKKDNPEIRHCDLEIL